MRVAINRGIRTQHIHTQTAVYAECFAICIFRGQAIDQDFCT